MISDARTFCQGVDVEEGQHFGVLIDFVARHAAFNDLFEEAVGHSAGREVRHGGERGGR